MPKARNPGHSPYFFAIVSDTSENVHRIHRYPAYESCNLDQMRRSTGRTAGSSGLRGASFLRQVPKLLIPGVFARYVLCERCFPNGWDEHAEARRTRA